MGPSLGHFVCYYWKMNNVNSNMNRYMNSDMKLFLCENVYG